MGGAGKLDEYRRKRSASGTPEPFGRADDERPGLFVVQKHRARRLHHDLRLEVGGVLKSWAVPKGPSRDPAIKRLAVMTEDHPLDYADFEGIIPDGNYGAGAMVVWDRGEWVPREYPGAGLEEGKLLFELRGYKLRGLWTLVRPKGSTKEWLLIKERDEWAETDPEPWSEASILSGRTVEELAAGSANAARLRVELEGAGLPPAPADLGAFDPMLAEVAEAPFTREGWVFELKWDGYRLLARSAAGEARLRLRRGGDATRTFPEVARALAAWPYDGLVIDGEVVVLDDDGRPVFQLLQQRAQIADPVQAERAAVSQPVTLMAFDLLALDGRDLRGLPLSERKRLLREVAPRVGPVRYADEVETEGAALYAQVVGRGLEGIVAKRADSTYRAGRASDWLKIRADRSADFAVCGWTEPKGTRSGFGALHLAVREADAWRYAGRVGSGFTEEQIETIGAHLRARRREEPPCEGAPDGAEHGWSEPELVVEVRYKEWTTDGLLRQPVFLRLRDDKAPEDCRPPGGRAPEPEPPAEPEPPGPRDGGRRELVLTRRDKVFWPDDGYTKGDLLDYQRQVADWLLPYLRDRPVVLVRYPDGIAGKSFFQKKPPEYVPEWIRTETIWSEERGEEVSHFIVDDLDGLLYLTNLGAIPFHVWAGRLTNPGRPDWCILDLDPKGAPFVHVVAIARAVHDLTESIGLPSFVKTSGSSGLHVLVPLGGSCTYDQARQLGQLLATIVARDLPDIATIARAIQQRQGKVYVDFMQNGQGRLLVAPLSVRPLAGAPVSTPLGWDEVTDDLDIRAFTIETVPPRLRAMAADPMIEVLSRSPDLGHALEQLLERMG